MSPQIKAPGGCWLRVTRCPRPRPPHVTRRPSWCRDIVTRRPSWCHSHLVSPWRPSWCRDIVTRRPFWCHTSLVSPGSHLGDITLSPGHHLGATTLSPGGHLGATPPWCHLAAILVTQHCHPVAIWGHTPLVSPWRPSWCRDIVTRRPFWCHTSLVALGHHRGATTLSPGCHLAATPPWCHLGGHLGAMTLSPGSHFGVTPPWCHLAAILMP